jgi:tRNA-Thr(GGU) m(6)t(6)A37 methyltransferase TsaA
MDITFRPIGIVHSPFKKKEDITQERCTDPKGFDPVRGELEILPAYEEGLKDIDGFSHLFVLFFFHEAERGALTAFPPRDIGEKGVFSTRSPKRPNPLGLTVVRLEGRKNNILEVAGLDMIEGTPILDIKPYTPRDQKNDVRWGWLKDLDKIH